ncbi:MAG: serine hydrolase [Syntrophobacterales bacterium]
MSRPARFLLLFILLSTPAVASAQGINEVVASTLTPWTPGLVVAVEHGDTTDFLGAFGHRAAYPDSTLSINDVFAFPGLSKLFVGVMVGALDSAGIVDEDAPLSTYLPSLSPVVGRATLRQLLTNTAGLHDASRIQGESWEQTLDRIDDHALVAEPGVMYNKSRLSLPLAVRVLEKVVGRPFDAMAATAILEPLDMNSSTFSLERARAEGLVSGIVRNNDSSDTGRIVQPADTVDGLPVLFTTATDVLRFLSAWMQGGMRCPGPGQGPLANLPGDAGWRYGEAATVGTYRGRPFVSLTRGAPGFGTSAGFYLLPEFHAAVFIWAVGEWPGRVGAFTLARTAAAFGARAAHTSPPGPSSEPGSAAGGHRRLAQARGVAAGRLEEAARPSEKPGRQCRSSNSNSNSSVPAAPRSYQPFTISAKHSSPLGMTAP